MEADLKIADRVGAPYMEGEDCLHAHNRYYTVRAVQKSAIQEGVTRGT